MFNKVKNGGPALATALACYFDFFALFIIFRLSYGALGTMEILLSFGKISLCAAVMGVGCEVCGKYTAFLIHSRFIVQMVMCAGLILGATLLFLGLAWAFRCHEIEEIYGIATRRKRGGEVYVDA